MTNTIAIRVKRLREDKGLDVGQLSYMSGVSGAHIYRIEGGERPNVSGIIVGQLARALGTTADYLLGLTDDPKPRPLPEAISAVEKVAGDSLFREVVIAWPELDQFGREFVRNAARAMYERVEALGPRRPALRLVAEEGPEYARDLDGAIAELVELYPDLGSLFDEAKEELPEHAVWTLVYNVRIWIERKEEARDFANVHQRLSDFLMGGEGITGRIQGGRTNE